MNKKELRKLITYKMRYTPYYKNLWDHYLKFNHITIDIPEDYIRPTKENLLHFEILQYKIHKNKLRNYPFVIPKNIWKKDHYIFSLNYKVIEISKKRFTKEQIKNIIIIKYFEQKEELIRQHKFCQMFFWNKKEVNNDIKECN